jgi:hypothetical protein
MTKQLSRRNMLGQAGLALGGLVTLGALSGCGEDETTCPVVQEPPPDTTPKALDWPYQKHIPATFQLDVEAVKEAAYNAYYAGGCCHGAYSALMGALQAGVGAPFDQLPAAFGKFGGGGIGGYGSICGAVLGSQLIVNMIAEDPPPPAGSTTSPNVRNAMIVEIMRWYETFAFPEFVPATRNAKEFNASGAALTVLNFDTPPESMRLAPGSHLCHASVTGWCTAQGVAANGPDKLARCARLTADVAGKTAELLNAYLASDRATAFAPVAPSGATTCVTSSCHGAAKVVDLSGATVVSPPVASGMSCTSCHPTAHGT